MKPPSRAIFAHKDLLGIEELTREEILLVLDTAAPFRDVVSRSIKSVPTLRGKTVVNLFFENSTRTRTSFDLAARRLSADVINFDVATSSVAKGEALLDTVETIEALGADYIVMRHGSAGSAHFLSGAVKASVINAGDGLHEHPTQALLDAFTAREALGVTHFKGMRLAIVGDILHSRVARSNIFLFKKLGAEVSVCGPPALAPMEMEELGVSVHHSLREGLRGADIVCLLRMQLERQRKNLVPSLDEYRMFYGLNLERLAWAKPGAVVMHPGPVNRGVEVSRDVLESPRSLVQRQVTNGVATRMAIFYLLQGAREHVENRHR
jgi:aspartate carbamoyltransferase catalytic subunit